MFSVLAKENYKSGVWSLVHPNRMQQANFSETFESSFSEASISEDLNWNDKSSCSNAPQGVMLLCYLAPQCQRCCFNNSNVLVRPVAL